MVRGRGRRWKSWRQKPFQTVNADCRPSRLRRNRYLAGNLDPHTWSRGKSPLSKFAAARVYDRVPEEIEIDHRQHLPFDPQKYESAGGAVLHEARRRLRLSMPVGTPYRACLD